MPTAAQSLSIDPVHAFDERRDPNDLVVPLVPYLQEIM
jgi:hypothetical protein